ncbi:MAG: DUF3021 domain-containing protein [Lachnospiraceae bacterium]|nr:DUF3021 domain-containing protein [Lachnospiraceae bacterium]
MKKLLKYFFLGIWTLYFVLSFINHSANYGLDDWIAAILITLLPYIIIWFINYKSRKTRTLVVKNTPSTEPTPPEVTSNNMEPYTSINVSDTESESVISKSDESQNIQYIEVDNVIKHTDGKSITDEEVSYLMQVGYEEALKRESKNANTKSCRTEQEELSFQFMMNHENDIQKHTISFEKAYHQAYSEKDLNKKIILLQNVIDLYEKEKKWFYKTKGGTIYFQDNYEHLHNSNNEDFSYIDSVKDDLEYNIHIRDYIIPEITQLITSMNGIMQKDIYSHFPDEPKSNIQKIIRELESDNIILRTKKSNSYFLTLNHLK